MKRVAAWLAILATVTLSAGPAWSACRQVVVRRAEVVVKKEVAAVVVPTLVAVPAAVAAVPAYPAYPAYPATVPQYSVTYDPLAELAQLRAQLDAIKSGLVAPGQAQAAPQAQPQAAEPSPARVGVVAPHVSLMQARCASCHENASAKTKGKGFVLFVGDKKRDLSAEETIKVIQRVKDDKHGPMMPMNGKPLDDSEFGIVSSGLIDDLNVSKK